MEMLITNPNGNRVGGLGPDDRFMEEPESAFWRYGDMKVATLETSGPYTIKLHGTGSGQGIIKVRTWGGSGLTDEAIFTHVLSTPNTTGSFSFGATSLSNLRLDVNGDGSDVRVLQPTLLTGSALNDVTPPVITILSPAAGQDVVGTFPVSWSATDSVSGVAGSAALIDKGPNQILLDQPGTAQLAAGAHSLDVWAEDRVENSAIVHRDFNADAYSWLPPLDQSFTGKVGQTIPDKFSLVTAGGAFVADQSVQLDLLDASGKAVTTAMSFGTDPDRAVVIQDGQYHGNLRTDGLVAGSYTIRVRFNSPSLLGTLTLQIALA